MTFPNIYCRFYYAQGKAEGGKKTKSKLPV